ncbi:MAG: glycosyltransferase [Bacteriovoracaceae bacterium]|nr:glycosyltransferase [Bacteriovoracaceae bacterium]
MPLVSVLIPTFNRASVVERAVKSVLDQTIIDLECLVIDDASTDHTQEILSKIQDCRLKVITHNENGGVSKSRNTGFQQSRGAWIALLDSDDEWLPERLDRQLEVAKNDPDLPLIHGEEIWIRNGKRIKQPKSHKKSGGAIFRQCLHQCLIGPSATLMKRELYEEMSGFREDYPVCEDYELWLRVTSKYNVGFVEAPIIIKYGGHEDQLSSRYKAMDYWRVRAMDEIFKVGNLSSEDEKELISVLIKKSEILKMGYIKHQNVENLPFIEDLLSHYGKLV